MFELPTTSRAAVVTGANEPIEIRDLPIPELEPGALLVRVDAATICGSDIHLWDGSLAAIRPIEYPVVPGHEMAGTVVAAGAGIHKDVLGGALDLGDRIIFTQGRCGTCFYCAVSGQPNLCTDRRPYGANCERYPYLVGGFSEYCYVYPTSRRVRIPSSVKSEWASAASCALRTVVGAYERLGSLEPWETVLVQGAGPLGLFATAWAKRLGARRIIVIGDPAERLALAQKWGADEVIAVSDFPDPDARVEHVRELTGGQGAEVVFEFSGARTAFAEGLAMTRRGGRYVVAGQVGPHSVDMSPTVITKNHLTVLGSFSAAESQYWRALQFLDVAQDEFDFDLMVTGRYHLDDVGKAYDSMRAFEEIKPVLLPWG